MRDLLVLDLNVDETLKTSKEIEDSLDGDWVFFDINNGIKAFAIFALKENQLSKLENSKFKSHLLQADDKFLDHLLGLFTPNTQSTLSVIKLESFKDFCRHLNNVLKEGKKVYDLSRNDFWIWHEPIGHKSLNMGEKLKDFLKIT